MLVATFGGVAEWSNAAVLKTVRPLRVSWVRILPPPQGRFKGGSAPLKKTRNDMEWWQSGRMR